jgi:hypothetical protein
MIGERAGTCKFMGKGRMDTGTPIFWGSLRELLSSFFTFLPKSSFGSDLRGLLELLLSKIVSQPKSEKHCVCKNGVQEKNHITQNNIFLIITDYLFQKMIYILYHHKMVCCTVKEL